MDRTKQPQSWAAQPRGRVRKGVSGCSGQDGTAATFDQTHAVQCGRHSLSLHIQERAESARTKDSSKRVPTTTLPGSADQTTSVRSMAKGDRVCQ
jgi:hypothetical protein